MDSIPQKRCTKCGQIQPLENFTKARWIKDGRYPSCKSCKNAQSRAYKAANPDLVRSRSRASAAKYRDAHRKRSSRYYVANREHVIKRTAVYRRAHPEVQRKAGAKWKAANRERFLEESRERSRRWRAANPDKSSAAAKRRLYRLKGAEGDHTADEWQALKAFYDYRCLCCGKREPEIVLTEDHIVPIARGGSNYISNIQPLCAKCNSTKRAKTIDYR